MRKIWVDLYSTINIPDELMRMCLLNIKKEFTWTSWNPFTFLSVHKFSPSVGELTSWFTPL